MTNEPSGRPEPRGPRVKRPIPFPSGRDGTELEKVIRQFATDKKWNVRQSLPTTRELGEHYAISNASVCRLLQRLSRENVVWRRDNGRYYFNESRRLYERHKPYACMLRKLETWTVIYQAIMSGFGQAFGQEKGAILFIHNESLFQRLQPDQPPLFASADEQRVLLREFLRDHEGQFRGILLDQVWSDDVLKEFVPQLSNSVIVCRPSTVPEISSVSVDFEMSGMLAVGHLYARGFDEIWLAVPHSGSVNYQMMATSAVNASKKLGRPIDEKNILSVATNGEREKFIARLGTSKKRVGIYYLGSLGAPPDHLALVLRRGLAAAGLECPKRVGFIVGMSIHSPGEHDISTFQVDYTEMGRIAGEILASDKHRTAIVPARLCIGATT